MRLVEFQGASSCGRIAVNPDLVTTVERYRDDATCIYVRNSNGSIAVEGSFDEVIAALTAEQPKNRKDKLVTLPISNGIGYVWLDPQHVTGMRQHGLNETELLLRLPPNGQPQILHVRGTPDEIVRALGLAGEGSERDEL